MSRNLLTQICLLCLLSIGGLNSIFAQGVKGHIYGKDNEVLPFSTIYIRNIESGTASNAEGFYELKLSPGKYDLVFQYLGYESLVKVVEVTNSVVTLDVHLKPQAIVLEGVVVEANKENPAFTIMRKAIAKAKYHTNQLDAYSSEVYVKGSGRLLDSPFFLRKKIAKEGIDSTAAFATESVIEVNYKRPNQYDEKVVSIRSSGESNNTSPAPFINGSFYESKIADAISPLSPRAFAYYKFSYQGTFIDGDYSISKIRVVPRSRGDDVFEGEIFIVEDQWSIHSLNLKTTKFGIDFVIRQIYKPIQDKAWLPISHRFDINGSFLGFDFEYDYLATISKYDITLNPDLDFAFEVIDEKVEKEYAKRLKEESKKSKQPELIEGLQEGKELTRKDLRKIIREYEKEELKKSDEPEVIAISNVVVDSLAHKKDSAYWAKTRPIPLTKYEVKGYQTTDSLAEKRSREAEGDTLKVGRKEGFRTADLLLGNTYKVGKKAHLRIKNPLLTVGYNTVEGFNFRYGVQYTKTFENKHWLSIEPTARYAFAREKLLGDVKIRWKWSANTTWTAAGGTSVNQFNPTNPIHPVVNTLSALFYERNFIRIYEQDFISLKLDQKISDKLRFSIGAIRSNRRELFNNTDFTIRDREGVAFDTNQPTNLEIPDTGFGSSRATLLDFSLQYRPVVKYQIRNKKKLPIYSRSPVFNLDFRSGLDVGDSEVSYNFLKVGVKHNFDIGVKGKLSYRVEAGTFLNDNSLTFIDFEHFDGNQTIVQLKGGTEGFRLLNYYEFSTREDFVTTFLHYDFRKLLLTRLPVIRRKGLKESMFVNYLATSQNQYAEVGYGVENIFRVFKVEGVASFINGDYADWGIRVGLSTSLGNLISVE